MADATVPPAGLEGVRETLFGRRGIVKAVHASLPLGVAASLAPNAGGSSSAVPCLLALLAAGCWAQAAILANDLTDSAEDAAAGKRRWVRSLRRGTGWAVVVSMVVAGALSTLPGGPGALIAYAAAVALGLFYSLRPARLKDRGLAGPFAYAAASALAYAVLPCAWLGARPIVLALLATAVLLDKWVNLQFHQVVDYAADRASRAGTHAVAVGPERARLLLKWLSWLTVAWLAGTAAFIAFVLPSWRAGAAGTVGLVVLLAGRYAHRMRERPDAASALICELPPAYLGLTLALFRALPLLLFARLATSESWAWGPLGAVAILVGLDVWHAVGYRYE